MSNVSELEMLWLFCPHIVGLFEFDVVVGLTIVGKKHEFMNNK